MLKEELIDKFPVLSNQVRLVRLQECCALVDRFTGEYILLLPFSGVILAMCNGSISLKRILKICSEILSFSPNMIKNYIYQTLEQHERFLTWSSQQKEIKWRYYPPDFMYEPSPRTEQRILPLDKPLQMTLVLTNKCNLRCIYCFRAAGQKWKKELLKDELIALIDQIAEMGLKHCTLTGGEPTLHHNFEDVVIKMLQKDIYPYISTNGTCISEVTLSRLKQAGLETIQFSLDTGKPDLYDKMMGVSGYFEKVLNTIKFAKSAGYIVNVKGVVTRLNAQTIGNLFDICADLGVDFVSVEAFSPGLHGRGNRDLLLTHKLAMKVKSLIEKASRLYSNRMLVAPFTVPKKWTGPADIIYCGGMYTAFVVQPDGSVCACEQVNDVSMNFGNIRDNPLTKIWASTRVLEFLNPDQSKVAEPCKSCKHFRRCRSGCFNYSLMYSDELYSPDPRCWKIKMGRDNPLKLEA